jgi:hypothetical protein
MKYDVGIALHVPVDDCGNKAGTKRRDASDPHFAGTRVGKKLDLLYALAQVVKHGNAAIEQCAPKLGWLDSLPMTVEQLHAESVLQFGNRSGNSRLRDVEPLRRLPHAAGLHHGHENVQVLQFHPASDAVAQLHGHTHIPLL